MFYTVASPRRAEDLPVAALELNGDDPGGVDLVVRLRPLDAEAAGEFLIHKLFNQMVVWVKIASKLAKIFA